MIVQVTVGDTTREADLEVLLERSKKHTHGAPTKEGVIEGVTQLFLAALTDEMHRVNEAMKQAAAALGWEG